MKKIFLLLIGISIFLSDMAFAQVLDKPTPPLNRAWEKENIPTKKPIPYVYLREQDVMFAKRMWQEIDLREKQNHLLYYPVEPIRDRISFTKVLWDAVTDGELIAYGDENFTMPKTPTEVIAENTQIDTIPMKSPITGNDTLIISTNEFNPADIKKIRITEDWFFNKQRSTMDVRILSIQPLYEDYATDPITGERVFKAYKSLFCIYFPAARPILARTEAFNTMNDGARLSFDDIFWKRMFGSYIIKEENVYDRLISDYRQGLDALMEAEGIKEKIRNYEHDLWEF